MFEKNPSKEMKRKEKKKKKDEASNFIWEIETFAPLNSPNATPTNAPHCPGLPRRSF